MRTLRHTRQETFTSLQAKRELVVMHAIYWAMLFGAILADQFHQVHAHQFFQIAWACSAISLAVVATESAQYLKGTRSTVHVALAIGVGTLAVLVFPSLHNFHFHL